MNIKALGIYSLVFILGAIFNQSFFYRSLSVELSSPVESSPKEVQHCKQLPGLHRNDEVNVTQFVATVVEPSIEQCVSRVLQYALGEKSLNVGSEVVAVTPSQLPYLLNLKYSDEPGNGKVEGDTLQNEKEQLDVLAFNLEEEYVKHFTLDETAMPPEMQRKLMRQKEMMQEFLNEDESSLWGIETAEKIESFIYNNENISSLDVDSIACRQKTCLLLISENEPGAMTSINNELYSHLSDGGTITYSASAMSSKDGRASYSVLIKRQGL